MIVKVCGCLIKSVRDESLCGFRFKSSVIFMEKLFMVFTISFSFVSTESKVIPLEFDVLSLKYVFIVFQKVACPLYY